MLKIAAVAVAVSLLAGAPARAQRVADIGFKSVGRGAPLAPATPAKTRTPPAQLYTPNRDENGNFVGLNLEGIFYDPEALVEPIRMIRNLEKVSGFEPGMKRPEEEDTLTFPQD